MFKVKNSASASYVYQNVLNHNKDDFKGQQFLYLKLNNSACYPSVTDEKIEIGCIGICSAVRTKLNLLNASDVKVSEFIIDKSKKVLNIKINICDFKKSTKIINIHEDIIKENFKKQFQKFYFYNSQTLVLKNNEEILSLHINCKEEGFLDHDCILEFNSDDVNINLISSSLLKRDLFREDYNFEDLGIGGLSTQLMDIFRRALSTRAIPSKTAEKLGIRHIKGVLLYGPPGTGKTLIARKIGGLISNYEPKIVNGPEIMDKFVGQSEKNIRELFTEARADYQKNKDNSGIHVIIFDEIDAICKTRGAGGTQKDVNDSVVSQLLSVIDGVNQLNNIFIIGMTNRKDLLDPALLRAGRIEIHMEIHLPDKIGREQIFRIHTNKMKNNNMVHNDVDLKHLAEITDNFSGSEIQSIVNNASSNALHEILKSDKKTIEDNDIIVSMKHFLNGINEVTPVFGNINKKISLLLPEKFIFLSVSYKKIYEEAQDFMNKTKNFKTILVYGSSGMGKTTFLAKIADTHKCKLTRFIRPIDVVTMDENGKSYHIVENIRDGYQSESSLILIDDLDICMNYAEIGNSVIFSNKIYQTILTILKTYPSNKNNILTIVVACGNYNLSETIKDKFDKVFKLPDIGSNDIKNILQQIKPELLTRFDDFEERKNDYRTIKDIINSI